MYDKLWRLSEKDVIIYFKVYYTSICLKRMNKGLWWATWNCSDNFQFRFHLITLLTYLLACLLYLLTHSLTQLTPWSRDLEKLTSLASQEVPHIVWNLNVHYCIHKCLPPAPILSQIDTVHTSTSRFMRIHLNIIFPLCLSLPSIFPSGFPTKALLCSMRATCPAHLILDFISQTILGEEYSLLSSSLCSFLHSTITSSLSYPNILLSTLFSNTLSVSNQVSHLYKTTGKIISIEKIIIPCSYCAPFLPPKFLYTS